MRLEQLRCPRGLAGQDVGVGEAEAREVGVEGDGALHRGDTRFVLAQEGQRLAESDMGLRQLGRQAHALPGGAIGPVERLRP